MNKNTILQELANNKSNNYLEHLNDNKTEFLIIFWLFQETYA